MTSGAQRGVKTLIDGMRITAGRGQEARWGLHRGGLWWKQSTSNGNCFQLEKTGKDLSVIVGENILDDGPQVWRTAQKYAERPTSVEDDPQDWTTAHKSNSFAFEHSGCFHARIIQIPNDDPTSMFTCPIEQWTRTRTGSFLACVQSLGHVSRFQPLLS